MSFTVNNSANSNGGSTSQAVTIAIAAGHTVVCVPFFDQFGAGGAITSITDSAGNTYTLGNSTTDGFGRFIYTGYSVAIASPITSVTAHMTGGTGGFVGLWVWDVSGTGAISFADTKALFTTPTTTGTDSLTSGSLTFTAADCLILSACVDLNSNSVATGTGFTADATGQNGSPSEHKAVTASAAATYTPSTAGDSALVAAIGLQISGAGAPAPFIPAPTLNTPSIKSQAAVFSSANLLLTTLAAVTIALPLSAGKVSASAPAVSKQVIAQNFSAPLTLGIQLPPNVRQQTESAPITKFQVFAENHSAPLTLGLPFLPPSQTIRGWTDSAPITKYQLIQENRSAPLTLGYPVPTVVPTIAFSPVPQTKRAVVAEQLSRQPLTLVVIPQAIPLPLGQPFPLVSTPRIPSDPTGFMAASVIGPPGPAPSVTIVPTVAFSPVPQIKRAVVAEQFANRLPLLPAVVTIPLPLSHGVDTSRLQVKFAVEVDSYPNLLATTLHVVVPLPLSHGTDTAQLQRKFSVQVDAYPNLLTTTLFTAVTPLALPLYRPVDVAQFAPKREVQTQYWPNYLPLGIPLPPPVTTGFHGRPAIYVTVLCGAINVEVIHAPLNIIVLSR